MKISVFLWLGSTCSLFILWVALHVVVEQTAEALAKAPLLIQLGRQ
jgi:hypothetical protein